MITLYQVTQGQPANDLCKNADEIAVTNGGFGLGTFTGDKVLINDATREIGEICSEDIQETGNCEKTVWYRFRIATSRNVEILLAQDDSMIPQIFAGFTVYKISNCDYNKGDVADQLTPVAKFGASGNSCLQSGTYYIQVAAKSKAMGDIWVELNISRTSSPYYNNHQTPFDVGMVKNGSRYETFDTECLDIEAIEQADIGAPEYSKSLWLKIGFPPNSIQDQIRLYNNQGNRKFAYRVFFGMPNNDSILSGKPFTFTGENGWATVYQSVCDGISTDKELFIQVVFHNSSQSTRIEVWSSTDIPDDWNSPSTTSFKHTIGIGYDKTFEKHFDCTGLLASHTCKKVIPDYFIRNKRDTFSFATYTIINSTANGELVVFGIDQFNRSTNYVYVLYKGDITSGCSLTEVGRMATHEATFCVGKGLYTLVIAHQAHSLYNNYVKLRIQHRNNNLHIDHFRHNNPEFIGNISSPDDQYGESDFIHIHHLDTTIRADTHSWTGRFIFTEIYVKKLSYFKIEPPDPFRFKVLLFKGRFVDGTAEYLNQFPNSPCQGFAPGYYSFVGFYDTSRFYTYPPCNPPALRIKLIKQFTCEGGKDNSEPGLALPVNNNFDVTSNEAFRIGIRYEYRLENCIDCNISTDNAPVLTCYRKKSKSAYLQDGVYLFYTFRIKENTEIEVPDYSILYRGNAAQNAKVCQDSNNIVDPCSRFWENIYCNLQAGYYTLVVVRSPLNAIEDLRLIATPHVKSSNDHAVTAHDLGQLTGLITTSSPPLPITCHTYSGPGDPKPPDGISSIGDRQVHPIPYKDTIDAARKEQRQNLWYTFTASDAKRLHVKVSSDEFCKERLLVFRYTGDFIQDFPSLIATGLDTTSANLEFVADNRWIPPDPCRENFVYFANKGCINNRYFILLEGISARNQEYVVSVRQVELQTQGDKGDFCRTAVEGTLSGYGSTNLMVSNYCHTYGDSPFEDDATDPGLVSTWFKVKVSDLASFDLSMRYLGDVSINGYNIYAGSCGALTKVMELRSKFSYFTLSCMAPGDFYIQAIADDHVKKGDLRFEVIVSQREDEKCKPYDFDVPIARFKILGGCNNDSLRFENQSTDGYLIRYWWYINGQLVDTSRELKLLPGNPPIQDSNSIKLVVLNTWSGYQDSATQTYFKDTNSYFFDIVPPPPFRCYDTVELSVETNYLHRINYLWKPEEKFENPYSHEQKLYRTGDLTAMVTGESDNCWFSDTIHLTPLSSSGLFKDTLMCTGPAELVYDLTDLSSVYVNGEYVDDHQLVIDQPGRYTLQFYYRGCWFSDTIMVERSNNIVYFEERDTTHLCDVNAKELKYHSPLKNFAWSTGSTDASILISKPGDYQLTGYLSGCSVMEYKVHVKDGCPFNVLIPNAFSPNGDHLNELFRPVVEGYYDELKFIIFNRWGEMLFESDGSGGWDGTYLGKPVQQGVYLVVIQIKNKENIRTFHHPIHVIW